MHSYSDAGIWNNNVCDLQLRTRSDNRWSNPTTKFVCGVGSATYGRSTGMHDSSKSETWIESINTCLSKRILFLFYFILLGDATWASSIWLSLDTFSKFIYIPTNLMSALEASVKAHVWPWSWRSHMKI